MLGESVDLTLIICDPAIISPYLTDDFGGGDDYPLSRELLDSKIDFYSKLLPSSI